MLAAERQRKIIEMIRKNGSVQVDELAKLMNVSLMTIRRDLDKLKQEGRINRCYGGAIIKREVSKVKTREDDPEGKYRIAEQCIKLMKKGMVVYLDSGSTTYEIAKRLLDIEKLTIITNDLHIAKLLLQSNANLIVCGGVVQKSTGVITGAIANMMMDNLKVDIAFLGTHYIDEQYNVRTSTMDSAIIKQTICQNTRERYLVADSSKFGKQASLKINHLSDYTAVITNKKFTSAEEMHLSELNATIISV